MCPPQLFRSSDAPGRFNPKAPGVWGQSPQWTVRFRGAEPFTYFLKLCSDLMKFFFIHFPKRILKNNLSTFYFSKNCFLIEFCSFYYNLLKRNRNCFHQNRAKLKMSRTVYSSPITVYATFERRGEGEGRGMRIVFQEMPKNFLAQYYF